MARSISGAITRSLETLSPRDRKLLAGMISFFSLIFVGILLFTLNSWLTDRAATIEQQKEKYALLLEMHEDYGAARQVVLDAEENAKKWKGKSASAFLEETAVKSDVREALTVSKQGQDTVGERVETRYKVVLKRVPLDQVVAFVYDIETQGYPINVESAEFKVHHVKGVKMITLTMDTIHYDYQEAG